MDKYAVLKNNPWPAVLCAGGRDNFCFQSYWPDLAIVNQADSLMVFRFKHYQFTILIKFAVAGEKQGDINTLAKINQRCFP